jgi:AcrR family transcriptional regulator
VARTPRTRSGTRNTVRERLVSAAFAQFADRGFEATTVDDIAQQAGVSRRTFFRHFATKEDAVFPDHDAIRAFVAADLERRRGEPPLAAVCAAVSLVLDDYVRNRDVSLARFQLTRSITALRDREVTNVHQYQRLFARYLADVLAPADAVTAELMAAAVVAGHNSVLREWLVTGGDGDPRHRLHGVLGSVQELFRPALDGNAAGSAVVVFTVGTPMAEIAAAISSVTSGAATPSASRREGRTRRKQP